MKNDPTVKQRPGGQRARSSGRSSRTNRRCPRPPKISFRLWRRAARRPRASVEEEEGKEDSGEEEEEKETRLLPHAAITVWEGHLLIASHIDFLLKVIASGRQARPAEGRRGLLAGR